MSEDTRLRFRVHGPPVTASRKASKKKASRKKTSGSAKEGSRRGSTVRKTARKDGKRKGTRKTQSRGKKKKLTTGAKRTRTTPSKKKSARAQKGSKASKAKRTTVRKKLPAKSKKGSPKGRKTGAKKSRGTDAKIRARRKAPKPKPAKGKKRTPVRKPKLPPKTRRKAKAVPKSKVPPKSKKRKPLKRPARGQVVRTKERERGAFVSAEPIPRPGRALIPHVLGPSIYYVDISKFDDYRELVGDDEEDEEDEEYERYTTSTSGMHPFNDNYLELFKQAFYDYTKKTRFEDMNDVPIFRYGLVIRSLRPRSGADIKKLVYQFADFLKEMLPRGASAHIVDEDRYISVRLGLGRYDQPTTFAQAYEYMKRNKELIWNFKRGAMDYLEDMTWFEYWDTEENYAES